RACWRRDARPWLRSCFWDNRLRVRSVIVGMVASLCEMRHLADTYHLSKEAYLRKTPKNGKSRALRFLGNPGGHCPCSSTPVGSGRLSGPRVSCLTRPPPVSTTKAPGVLYFRGSITRPLTSLSTLRR